MAGSEKTFFLLALEQYKSAAADTHSEPIYALVLLENAPFHFERGLISILLRPVLVRNYQQRESAENPSHAQGLLRKLFK
jgi:hypothetical protein